MTALTSVALSPSVGHLDVVVLRKKLQSDRVVGLKQLVGINDEGVEPLRIAAFGDPLEIRPHRIPLADRVGTRGLRQEDLLAGIPGL